MKTSHKILIAFGVANLLLLAAVLLALQRSGN